MSSSILIFNAGSSSLKYQLREGTRVLAAEHLERIHDRQGEAALTVLEKLKQQGLLDSIVGVGHRIVHGGDRFDKPVLLTPEVLAELQKLSVLAPLHNPPALAVVQSVLKYLPKLPQVACFDTAFHATLPDVEKVLAIPRNLRDQGIRRYGFHGLSYQSIVHQLRRVSPAAAQGKTVICHLGNGASVCGINNGISQTTSMSFTPLDGVVMGTRPGRLDPGVVLHLIQHLGQNAKDVETILEHQSGMLGLSGFSGDVRDLLASPTPEAEAAINGFVRSVVKEIASAAAVLEGLDAIVFTAGIGEGSPFIRARICQELQWLGVRLSPRANAAQETILHTPGSAVEVLRLVTQEEEVIAAETLRLIGAAPAVVETPAEDFTLLNAYWRAANYLSVGQIYLLNNPLLKTPLKHSDVKPRLLGHWGTTPGLNFIYAHLNRVIKRDDLNVLYVAGPGHGGPGLVANVYLEGTYSEVYPKITPDAAGIQKLFKQFSFPGGIPSHVAPETPGSIHEGGELGYSLSHSFGAAFDNPDLIVACVVGDGEAETGPAATGWHGNKFLNPARDGAVLPILHLNGYKIANPTLLARLPEAELIELFRGYGYDPHIVEGHDPALMHPLMAETLDKCIADIQRIWKESRTGEPVTRPIWPMIILRTLKGWTCPHEIDGKVVEGSWRSHQVPMGDADTESHLHILEGWLKSYKPEELFDDNGTFKKELAALAPQGARRMGANPHANGGVLLKDLKLPDYHTYAVAVPQPGAVDAEATRVQGQFIRDVMKLNLDSKNFRVVSPDENASNRWGDLFTVTDRCMVAEHQPNDDHVSPGGRVMEVLSEHQCQGWLEGYLLTGRHGFFNCYEAFIHIIDSMFNQHAKWLKVCQHIPWRKPIASLNYLLTSHVWRQDHNGFSHQDPGFLDHVVNKKSEIVRIYLPPDANTLLSVTDHCLRSRNYVNVIVAGKQPAPQWVDMTAAAEHCRAGIGVWKWASNDDGAEPDVVLGCCGDVPTLEALAAVKLIWELMPGVTVRLVNVVDLMRLQEDKEHPHGLGNAEFDALFTTNRPIIFAFHGYPWLIHRLTYRRKNHGNLHVRGYKEEGTTTTPFDMVVLNDLDRFKLVMDVIDRVPGFKNRYANVYETLIRKREEHKQYIYQHGEDMPEIRHWRW